MTQKKKRKEDYIKRGKIIKHAFTKHPLKETKREMIRRCYDPYNKDYHNYGARGITVCKEWLDDPESFFIWSINEGGWKKGLTLDRIDNNEGYSPNNCRYVTFLEQANNRRNNVFIEYKGERKTMSQWARRFNISPSAIRNWKKCNTVEKNMKKYLERENLHKLEYENHINEIARKQNHLIENWMKDNGVTLENVNTYQLVTNHEIINLFEQKTVYKLQKRDTKQIISQFIITAKLKENA